MFITFEGPDGSGKSTVVKRIEQKLTDLGVKFLLTNEPGNPHSEASKKIREVITDKSNDLPDITEALLFAADRRMHLDNIIIPALNEGKVVLSDRYVDSSLAYQGAGREIGIEKVKQINEIATEKKYPDLTIFFDITPEESARRLADRTGEEMDRLELAGRDFHKRVYEGYKKVVEMFPERIVSVDASQSRDDLYNEVEKIVLEALNK